MLETISFELALALTILGGVCLVVGIAIAFIIPAWIWIPPSQEEEE
jgi:hypothetical protein